MVHFLFPNFISIDSKSISIHLEYKLISVADIETVKYNAGINKFKEDKTVL